MAWIMQTSMVESLMKDGHARNDADLKILYYNLRRLDCMSTYSDVTLFLMCRQVVYEFHEAKSVLYRQGDEIQCWYIVVSGCLYINGAVFLPTNCVGKRDSSCNYRQSDCLVLEPTQLIMVSYPDARRKTTTTTSVSADVVDSSTHNEHVSGSEADGSQTADRLLSTSSADVYCEDLEEDEDNEMLMSMLEESNVDSDSEDICNESYESVVVQDKAHEILQKSPTARTEEDIDVLLDFMQNLPAFSNMTVSVRQALCAVMVYKVIDKPDTVLYDDGDVINVWSAILNGLIEVVNPDGSSQELHVHDSFGYKATRDVNLVQRGTMRTKTPNCQLVHVAHDDYFNILHQGAQNTHCLVESGCTVLVTEKRTTNKGTKTGDIIIRGTAEKLTSHLVADHSSVDPTYVEDFLLTYRTFLSSPMCIAERMLDWFKDPTLRDKVIRVVLLWVNNHFRDFEMEPEMADFLDKFMSLLEKQGLEGQLLLLRLACSANSHPRSVHLQRDNNAGVWPPFDVLFGGSGTATDCRGTFITGIETTSRRAGLRTGDQILEVNGLQLENMPQDNLLQIFRTSANLKLTVRCNFKDLHETLKLCKNSRTGSSSTRSSPEADTNTQDSQYSMSQLLRPNDSKHKHDRIKSASSLPSAKLGLYKALQPLLKLASLSKTDSVSTGNHGNTNESSFKSVLPKHSRLRPSTSDPDLSLTAVDTSRTSGSVIRVYQPGDSYVSVFVTNDMTVADVVSMARLQFGISDMSGNYLLYEVSFDNGSMRQSRLFDYVSNLADRCSPTLRFYLLNSAANNSMPMSVDSLTTSHCSLLHLHMSELGFQLTNRDFQLFRSIEPSEYINDLFACNGQKLGYGTPNLLKFSELANLELFWVASQVCTEQNVDRRARIVQHFIKLARYCQEASNFNSLFAIVGGLSHGSVSRLHQTWDKVSSKYNKMFRNMQALMDPTRNMSNYRNLLAVQLQQSPAIPFFPIVKKDLTFIHLGNDSKVDGLVNFEKLRMMAKEIHHVCNMASEYYHKQSLSSESPSSMSLPSPSNISVFATLSKKRSLSSSNQTATSRRTSEEDEMTQHVKVYLDNLPAIVISDETKLIQMSHLCEPPVTDISRKQDMQSAAAASSLSPVAAAAAALATTSLNIKQAAGTMAPKFGTESTVAVQKLMSLTDRVRPHDSKKHPLPQTAVVHTRPASVPSTPVIMRPTSPVRPRRHHVLPVPAVHLSAESSSVGVQPAAKTHSIVSGSKSVGTVDPLVSRTLPFSKHADNARHSYNDASLLVTPVPLTGRVSAPVSPCHHVTPVEYESVFDRRSTRYKPVSIQHSSVQHARVHSLDSAECDRQDSTHNDHLSHLTGDEVDQNFISQV